MKYEHLTIMFTDIKGFTQRTARSSRKELERLLEVHDELVAPVFEQFGGTIVKTIGDAFMVKFNSPTDAVLCGVEIQRVLREYNESLPKDEQIEVRIAINSGECTVKGNDVFGETVNIAARLEGIAEAGDIYFTESVYLAMNKNEVPTAEVGIKHFKGIDHEIKVYKVLSERRRGLLGKREKPVKRRRQKSWLRRHWKWVVIGIIIFLIIANAGNQENKSVKKDVASDAISDLGLKGTNQAELEAEIRGIGEQAVQAIRHDRPRLAREKLEQLHRISDHFGNPPEIEEGIAKIEKLYDEKYS